MAKTTCSKLSCSTSMFASKSVFEHIVRGACAIALACFGIGLLASPDLLRGIVAAVSFVGVVVLLRGCPTCWLIGLFATIAREKPVRD